MHSRTVGNNRTSSASMLGISRSTLKKKIADNPSLREISR
ncbi:MAG: hypothetical protein KJ550_06395 [Proteobacteria bacterium]|nr:hypothetical protein [Desulfobacteraceae bacterium]MBU3980449.1 hypothetical protein [Pseudomonadota bacterium]MBU4013077.1 hypothetical protein [Pseudomonadota bacterium]MBU4068080.1 hypothetical protein [Pseudomonadota bacterium]MBU4101884.1 hypothetical protein [Pseudomonadota bacterium]